jgi:putative Mn2+ efflux pump MntP
MNLISIIIIAIGLAMDAFAMAISCGLYLVKPKYQNAIRIALYFAVFQIFMPVLGWFLGDIFQGRIAHFDHWLAFGILLLIGIHMIYQSFQTSVEYKPFNPSKPSTLLGLAIVTSIDAFAVGVSFAFLGVHILEPVLIIGLITFIISSIGVALGDRIGTMFGRKAEIFGGLVLISIGVKILLQDLFP